MDGSGCLFGEGARQADLLAENRLEELILVIAIERGLSSVSLHIESNG